MKLTFGKIRIVVAVTDQLKKRGKRSKIRWAGERVGRRDIGEWMGIRSCPI